MPWYKVSIPNPMHQMSLQNEYTKLWLENRSPKDAVILCDQIPTLNHDFYFSPNAVRIASELIERYSGEECPMPTTPSNMLLVAGDGGWKSAILPSQ